MASEYVDHVMLPPFWTRISTSDTMNVPGTGSRIEKDDSGLMRPSSASGSIGRMTTPTGRRPWLNRATVVLGLLLVIVLGAAVAPRVIDMRYLNIPVVHPWPPVGYQQNPLNQSNRADIIPVAESQKVKEDLLADGKLELAAVAAGNGSDLAGADTGRSLVSLRALVVRDAAAGVTERSQTELSSVTVGYLDDPNDTSIRWCVVEKGRATLTSIRKDTGEVVVTRSYGYVGTFWLKKIGDRYLIADRSVQEQ